MKWQLERETKTLRIYAKTVNGERVERVQRYGIHAQSIFQQNAIGTYARSRWATTNFKALGETFGNWGDTLEFLNDLDAVAKAKSTMPKNLCLPTQK